MDKIIELAKAREFEIEAIENFGVSVARSSTALIEDMAVRSGAVVLGGNAVKVVYEQALAQGLIAPENNRDGGNSGGTALFRQ